MVNLSITKVTVQSKDAVFTELLYRLLLSATGEQPKIFVIRCLEFEFTVTPQPLINKQ